MELTGCYSKAETLKSLKNSRALNVLSKCKVALLKVKNQGGTDTKQRSMHNKPKNG